MALTVEAYARQLRQLLPPGAAFSPEPSGPGTKLLLGLAEEYARVDGRVTQVIDEWDPRTALEMLTDWERVLDLPDSCVEGVQSLAQRRAACVARLIAIGAQTPAYYVALAAALGFAITITEYRVHDVDQDCEFPLYDEAWAYAWRVTAAIGATGEFTVLSAVDEALAWWGNSSLECVIGRLKPAHTTVVFAYN